MADLFVKQNARRPLVRLALFDESGAALDLTGATAKFVVRQKGAATRKIDAAMSIFGAATNGVVEYAYGATDTDTAGEYQYEVHVTLPGGILMIVPSDRYHKLTVVETL